MAISSYSHTLHDSTAFTLIQKNDGIFNMAWKIPAGRVAAATTFSFALIEALFATVLTALTSPLYIIDGRPFKSFSSETLDASKTALFATKRFVGLENSSPERPAHIASKSPPRSLEPKAPSLLSKAGNLALSNPNALFVVSALTIAAAGAYFFGVPSYFMSETVPTPTPTPEPPNPLFHNFTNTSNTCDAPIPTPTPEPATSTSLTQLFSSFINTTPIPTPEPISQPIWTKFVNTSNTCDAPIPTPTPEPISQPIWTKFVNTSNTCDAPIPTPTPEPIEPRTWTQLINNFMNSSNTCFPPEEEFMPEPILDKLGRQLAFVSQHKKMTGENLLSRYKLSLQ